MTWSPYLHRCTAAPEGRRGPCLLLTEPPHRPGPPVREQTSGGGSSRSALFAVFTLTAKACALANSSFDATCVTDSCAESSLSSQEKMEYSLGSRVTKIGSSTTEKLSRNSHCFSWYNCFSLAAARRAPVGDIRKPALGAGRPLVRGREQGLDSWTICPRRYSSHQMYSSSTMDFALQSGGGALET